MVNIIDIGIIIAIIFTGYFIIEDKKRSAVISFIISLLLIITKGYGIL